MLEDERRSLADLLIQYSKNLPGRACIPEFVDQLTGMGDIYSFTSLIDENRINGRSPILTAYRPAREGEVSGVQMSLYFDLQQKQLFLNWIDADYPGQYPY